MWAKCFKNSCKRVRFHLLTLTLRSISFTVSIKPFNVRQKGAKMKIFVTFFVLSGRFKDGWIQFSACKFIKNWIFFENLFDVFCLLSRNTYFDEQLVSRCSCLYLTRPPSIVHKQRHFHLMLKKPNYIAFFTVNRKENASYVHIYIHGSSHQELFVK